MYTHSLLKTFQDPTMDAVSNWLVIFGDLKMIKLLLSTQTFNFILNSILKTPNIVRLI